MVTTPPPRGLPLVLRPGIGGQSERIDTVVVEARRRRVVNPTTIGHVVLVDFELVDQRVRCCRERDLPSFLPGDQVLDERPLRRRREAHRVDVKAAVLEVLDDLVVAGGVHPHRVRRVLAGDTPSDLPSSCQNRRARYRGCVQQSRSRE